MKCKRSLLIVIAAFFLVSSLATSHVFAYTFDHNDIIDDSVFNNYNAMSSAQVDTFLNGFASSCISSNSGFMANDPTGYSPSTGYQYGGFVTAGKVIYDAAQAYGINPQVLITTLEKEQSLVTGQNNFAGYCNNGEQHKYAAAVGYGCPDSGTRYSYTGLSLYQRNGVTVSSTGTTCVNTASKAGFSEQVIRAAWLLKFGQQRSRGNVGWAVIKGSWDNSDDPQSCYSGPTTAGTFAVCPSAPATYHDGSYTIDGTSVQIGSGATAALYWYTPHFSGNSSFYNIFTQWFGTTKSATLPGCAEATNTTRSCIWSLTSPTGKPFYTSSVGVRQALVDDDDYDYIGRAFFGNVVPLTGNIPIYRLTNADGSSFLTANQAEYNSLVTAGWTGTGIDFYADPANSNSGYPVYRLYSAATGMHKWSSDGDEIGQLMANGYTNEGQAFTAISPLRQEVAPQSGKLLNYRFYIPQSNSHLWTTSVYERDNMISAGYTYEGVAWQTSATATSQPVYRLYAPSMQQHLYTASANEEQTLVGSGGWKDEGVAFYVSPGSTAKPVYRLYAPSLGVHQLTTDSNERSQLIQSGGWKDEGVAWYLP